MYIDVRGLRCQVLGLRKTIRTRGADADSIECGG